MAVIKACFPLFLFVLPLTFGDFQIGSYNSTCPRAETIVRSIVANHFKTDPSITAALLRMQFHDCFVKGCDASILIDGDESEKEAGANGTVRGFELIDEIKKAIEEECPETVSCADIIVLATKDAVALAGGPNYTVPTGRLDGLSSNFVDVDLPGAFVPIPQAGRFFQDKGFTVQEMVTLLGAHTVGVAHCFFFSSRLRNDPSMDPTLSANLSKTCASSSQATVFLDQGTAFTVDNEYYKQILMKKGIMTIDSELATDSVTSGIVSSLARDAAAFQQSFANAMVKMGKVEIKTRNDGEIRKNCRVFNSKSGLAPAPSPQAGN